MSVVDATFRDGTQVHLDVGLNWPSILSIFFVSIDGTVNVFKPVKKNSRQWWCGWLCKREETENEPVKTESIVIEAMGVNDQGKNTPNSVTNLGEKTGKNCSNLTDHISNADWPSPLIPGGGQFDGIGFKATITHNGEVKILHDHWQDQGRLPQDFS